MLIAGVLIVYYGGLFAFLYRMCFATNYDEDA